MTSRFQISRERCRPYAVSAGVVLFVVAVVTWAARSPLADTDGRTPAEMSVDVEDTVRRADHLLERRWRSDSNLWKGRPLTPADPADDLIVLRRLSLSLHGTVPSLEEVREFEADDRPRRLQRWTVRMLDDKRFADYFAERLARAYVSSEGGTFIIYRRDRFVNWLREQLRRNRPYDEMVREMISADGLWTGEPATNFMTSAYNDGRFDVNKLAGRTARAFLGQRLDCAQCHDHKFDERWKQHHFEGLAAFYGQSQLTPFGVEDKATRRGEPVEYVIRDRKAPEGRTVKPDAPFHPEWLPGEGDRRERLARWITHERNRRFGRAIANRVWALLFGRPYTYPWYAVDDLPNPDDEQELCDTKLLDALAADFREHGCDLRRLILVITSMRAFRLSSSHPADRAADSAEERREIADHVSRLENNWAVFPITRLRPEQVIGAMLQTNSLRTIDRNSNLPVRVLRLIRERYFVEEYGDRGGEELVETAGTIAQALLRMNGKLPQEVLKATPFSASGRIAQLAGSDRQCVETCFLVGLTRRPTDEELRFGLSLLQEADGDRRQAIEDLYWQMFNAPEFSWNH